MWAIKEFSKRLFFAWWAKWRKIGIDEIIVNGGWDCSNVCSLAGNGPGAARLKSNPLPFTAFFFTLNGPFPLSLKMSTPYTLYFKMWIVL